MYIPIPNMLSLGLGKILHMVLLRTLGQTSCDSVVVLRQEFVVCSSTIPADIFVPGPGRCGSWTVVVTTSHRRTASSASAQTR